MGDSFREPPPTDSGEESDPLILDPDHFKNKYQEEKDRRKRLERALQHEAARRMPMAITPELLEQTLTHSFQHFANRLTPRTAVKMPQPGTAGAPDTFMGTSSKLLPDFFRRFESCLREAEIDDDEERLRHLPKYVGAQVREWIEAQITYRVGDYYGLKKELLTLYNNPEKKDPYNERDLEALANEYSKVEITHQDHLSERLMIFNTMAKKLVDSGTITEEAKNKQYFLSFTPSRRRELKEHLSKMYPMHPRDRAHDVPSVYAAAKHLLVSEFDVDVAGDPRTNSQRLLAEVKLQKVEEPKKAETEGADLYGLISKMNQMNIQDPLYVSHYVLLCRAYPEAMNYVRKPPSAQSPQQPSGAYAPNATFVQYPPRLEWPRSKCFYCAREGCQTRGCPMLMQDEKEGLVKRDGLQLVYRNGERLVRREGGFREDVMSRKSREEMANSVRDKPPHQTNMYEVMNDEEYRGMYIGVQEIDDTEEVSAYTYDEEEERTVDLAESYYMEMVQEGLSDSEATQRAWVMATTRTGTSTRDARESAKPYDREKGKGRDKGKGKGVRFDEPSPPSTSTGVLGTAIQPVNEPTMRFPPASAMTMRPPGFAAPASADWPRPPKPTAPPATIGAPSFQKPLKASTSAAFPKPPALSKAPTIPEIDMTPKEPGPKYRFTSEVEEGVDMEGKIDRLLGDFKIEVGLMDLLALSPTMRKRVTEMTKTKRVPTESTSKVKISMVLQDEDEQEYISMPVIEAGDRSPKYSAALPRLQAEIAGVTAVGMLDTGSQINLMTEEFWLKTGLPINETRKIRMRGVNLTGDQSLGLCEFVEVPFAGVTTLGHYHVFKKAPYPFIMGQPWIQDHLIASTETGHTYKILIRDFRNAANRVTMVLRNEPLASTRGDVPNMVEVVSPQVEVMAYGRADNEAAVDPETFAYLEKALVRTGQREVITPGALTCAALEEDPFETRKEKSSGMKEMRRQSEREAEEEDSGNDSEHSHEEPAHGKLYEEEERDGVAYFRGVASKAAGRVMRWMKEKVLVAAAKYKPVDRKVRPVPGVMPENARTVRRFPSDPLDGYTKPSLDPPPFADGARVTRARLDALNMFKGNFLTAHEKRIAEHVLRRREMSLAFDETEKGRFREDYFSDYVIPVVPHEPWQEKPIRIPPAMLPGVTKLFKQKVANGTYEPTQSSYCSKWFAVVKKSGEFRIVHDLQPLNAVTIRDAGVPPAIEEFVEEFAGRSCYSLLDIFVGFDNRTLHPLSRDLTAFMGPDGRMYRLCVLPMGGANCVPEFQACMGHILQDEMPLVVGVFVDDVGVKGGRTRYELADGTYEVVEGYPNVRRFIYEHLCDVDRVLTRIGHSGATVAAKKLVIAAPEAVIVGQKCTYEGRLPDDTKVSKIRHWPTPRNTTDVRGFLGLCAGVRMFIKDYSRICRPLNHLLCKDVDWDWTEEQEAAMEKLKLLVSQAPCLTPIDYTSDREVIFAVDSSFMGVGFVLMQLDEKGVRRPSRYGSLSFNEREQRYSQPKSELFGLYRACKKCMLYLIGVRNLVIEVDASCLKGMINSPDQIPSATINRWIEGILMLQFRLRHVKGKKHLAADGLSRRPRAEEDSSDGDTDDSDRETMANRPKWSVENEGEQFFEGAFAYEEEKAGTDEGGEARQRYETMAIEVENEPIQKPHEHHTETPNSHPTKWSNWLRKEEGSDFSATRTYLERFEQPDDLDPQYLRNFIDYSNRYFIRKDRLYRRKENGLHQLVVRKEDRGVVLAACHDKLGHKGVDATEKAVAHRFWWKGIRSDVEGWVKSCVACQKRSEKKPLIPVTPSRPTQIFRHMYIDCMNMPKASGKTQIVAARDDLSGYIEARMLTSASARNVAAFLWEDIICRWGSIEVLTSDNGSEFIGEAVKLLVDKYGVYQIKISPYNSRASGVVERGHRTFREALIRSCDNPLTWPTRFYHTLWAERVTIRASTGYSPFYLVMGYQPCLPIDALQLTFAWDVKAMSHADLVAERAKLLMKKDEDEALARERIAHSRWKSAQRWNEEHQAVLDDTEHLPGDLVLIRNTAVEKEMNRKHKPRWLGPMVVVRRTPGTSYICAELSGAVSKLRFAAFRVKKFIARDGLTFDVEDWLGRERVRSIEEELIAEEDEARAWTVPNGDEGSDDEIPEPPPDGEETVAEERQAVEKERRKQIGPRMRFDGVVLPRIPNLPRFTLAELEDRPRELAVETTVGIVSSCGGPQGPL